MTNAEVIARDGTVYIQMAQDWSQNGWDGIKGQTYHPGYPVTISWVQGVLNAFFHLDTQAGWELFGLLVSLISNLLAIAGIWCFAGMIFNWRVAFITALLFGISRKFAAIGADVLSDSQAICFQIWAVVLAVKVFDLLKGKSKKVFLLAGLVGLFGGLAYLVRIEALVVVVLSGLLWLTVRKNWTLKVASMAVMLLVCIACMSPYMLAVDGLTTKKGLADFVIIPGRDLPAFFGLARVSIDTPVVFKFVGQLSEALNPVLLFPAVIWLIGIVIYQLRKNRKPVKPEMPKFAGVFMMAGAIVLLAPALIGQYYKHGFMSHRYFMFPAALISPLAGAGVLLLARYAGFLGSKIVKLKPPLIEGFIVAVFAIGILGNTVKKPLHAGKGYLRKAGQDVARSAGKKDKVFSDSRLVLYYAKRRGILLDSQRLSPAEIVQQVSANSASSKSYLVLTEATLGNSLSEIDSVGKGQKLKIELVNRVEQQGKKKKSDTVRIYRVGP